MYCDKLLLMNLSLHYATVLNCYKVWLRLTTIKFRSLCRCYELGYSRIDGPKSFALVLLITGVIELNSWIFNKQSISAFLSNLLCLGVASDHKIESVLACFDLSGMCAFI